MTYRQLLQELQKLSPDSLEDEVMIFDPSLPTREEFYPVTDIGVAKKGSPADLRGMLYTDQVFITMGAKIVPSTIK